MEPKNEDSIQVYIRVKPDQEDDSLVAFSQSQIRLDKNRFAFDKIFPPTATQQDIFQAVGTKVLTHTLDGYNGCIFVYGQTGSGKTHTMIGQNKGLMQRSFSQLFNRIYALPNSESTITCSYFEIYNQQINDLLDNKKDKRLNIRQDTKRGVFVENLNEEVSRGPAKLMECLSMGMKNRHVGQTLMNRQSSRSHSIFTISISLKIQVQGKKVLKTPKLHFVDLAGSERQKMTAASGDRLKQAGNINKSLTTLGMVINALTSDKQRNHIPYRDSKLTNLLKDSLGGNSKTFIIATVSCSVLSFQETLSTLNFANRAKMVKVKAEINEESLSNNIESFKDEIKRLKAEIIRLKSQKSTPAIETKEIQKFPEKIIDEPKSLNEQIQEMNNSIKVISEHLMKNPIGPTLEPLVDYLGKMKLKRYETKSTIQETEEEERPEKMEDENQDVFLEYLSNNNQLLQLLSTKINEFNEFKEHFRNLVHREQICIAELKTPSKLEREQYEERLAQREEEIMELYEQIKKLNEEIVGKSMKIKELSSLNSNNIEEKQMEMTTMRNSLLSLENEALNLRKMLSQAGNEKDFLQKRHEQIKRQCTQNKQLYLFSEEKFKIENQMRQKLQLSLKTKVSEIEDRKVQFHKQMEEARQKFEEREEQLTQQIDVLVKSVDFNKKLVSEFQQKCSEQKQKSQHILKKLQESKTMLANSQADLEEKQEELRNLQRQYENQIHTATNQYNKIKESLDESMENYSRMCSKYQHLETTKNEQIQNYCKKIETTEKELTSKTRIISSLEMQCQEQQSAYQKQKIEIQCNYKSELDSINNKMIAEGEEHEEELKLVEEEMKAQKEKYHYLEARHRMSVQEKYSLHQENLQMKQQLTGKNQEIKNLKTERMEEIWKLAIENEHYQKNNTELNKENYKLKRRVSGCLQKGESELVSRVEFYESKFQELKSEIKTARNVIRKQKEKELKLQMEMSELKEGQKNAEIVSRSQAIEETQKQLLEENQQLKKEREIMKKQNASKDNFMTIVEIQKRKQTVEDQEEEIKSVIVEALKEKSIKENVSKDMTIRELMNEWLRAEEERKKAEELCLRGIKKEQRIKTHNCFVEKQNVYLKEQLKGWGGEGEQPPRKRVKLDEDKE